MKIMELEERILEKLGLTQGETKTYVALLKLGSSSTGPIAKASQVSRSKLYSILDKLEKKGFVSHIERNGVVYFQSVEPTKIKDYLKDKEDELKDLEQEFEKYLPSLNFFYERSGTSQNVTVYQGLKGLRVAHEHTYLKLRRGEEYCYLGIPPHQPEEHHLYWQKDHKRRAEAGIECKLLFNRDTAREVLKDRNGYSLCDARYMPVNIKTPTYFLIYKDTTMMAIPSKDPITIEIINQEITNSFKAYFEEFWKKSKPFK
jgi:sugar-specific transcriptional regulator TrmB